MGHCKDCKYWGLYYPKACDNVDNCHPEETDFDMYITADDDQGLDANLLTGPEFGCVHFTEGS